MCSLVKMVGQGSVEVSRDALGEIGRHGPDPVRVVMIMDILIGDTPLCETLTS